MNKQTKENFLYWVETYAGKSLCNGDVQLFTKDHELAALYAKYCNTFNELVTTCKRKLEEAGIKP